MKKNIYILFLILSFVLQGQNNNRKILSESFSKQDSLDVSIKYIKSLGFIYSNVELIRLKKYNDIFQFSHLNSQAGCFEHFILEADKVLEIVSSFERKALESLKCGGIYGGVHN